MAISVGHVCFAFIEHERVRLYMAHLFLSECVGLSMYSLHPYAMHKVVDNHCR